MKYENAKDILPAEILKQVQKYAAGKLLYIPVEDEGKDWGEVSGYRQMLMKRNRMICNRYANGTTISELADEYYLSLDSIKKIIYCKKNKELEFTRSLSSAIDYANAGMMEEWIRTYLMFCTNQGIGEEFLQNGFISFGMAKIPLRLIQQEEGPINSEWLTRMYGNSIKETEPLIVRFEKGRFYTDSQKELLQALKHRKINAYPAFILTQNKEEHKVFMNHYGRHFILISKC